MFDRRRAIDARARQIVEESGSLWAVARDQAKAELGFDSIPSSPSASWQDALSAVVIAAVSAVLLVVVFFVFAFVAAVACGGLFDSMAPLNTPCDRRAENGYVVWLAFTACGFVASFVLAFTKRQPAWMFAPVLVGVTAAIVIGTVLVAAA